MDLFLLSMTALRNLFSLVNSDGWMSVREFITVLSIVIGMLSGLVAVIAYINSLAVRKVDIDNRRFDRTVAVIEKYNEKWTSLIEGAVTRFDESISDEDFARLPQTESGKYDIYLLKVANSTRIIETLHFLNLIGYEMNNDQYIFRDDLKQAISSEVYRSFSKLKYRATVRALLKVTSMEYVAPVFSLVGIKLVTGGSDDGRGN